MLLLDAAYPPPPAQLVADCKAVGASGCFAYAGGDGAAALNYTSTHVDQLRAAGLTSAPIIVPGNNPGAAGPLVDACRRLGFAGGPVVFDLETGSEPADSWWRVAHSVFDAAGFRAELYGTTAELGRYSPGDDQWIASWLRKGILDPIPQLPAGWHAWQFVDDVVINGHTYDVSVVSPEFLIGADTMIQLQETVDKIHDQTGGIFSLLSYGSWTDPKTNTKYVLVEPAPAIDVAQLAADIAPQLPHVNPADVSAIATAVLQRLGKAASSA